MPTKHQRTPDQGHQALALDETGVVLGQWRGANTLDAWAQLLAWAATFPGPRQWGIEGAWNYGRGLAQFLVAQGERVYEVNPRWTAERRRSARKAGKSDRLDAHAVAKLVRDEASTLPRVTAEDESVVLDLLVTEHESALPRPRACATSCTSCSCRSIPTTGGTSRA